MNKQNIHGALRCAGRVMLCQLDFWVSTAWAHMLYLLFIHYKRNMIFDFFHKIAGKNWYLMLRNRDTKVQEKIKRMMRQSTELLRFLQ